jgi:hypothetical protein
VLPNVDSQLSPYVLLIADLLALGADWEKSFENLDLGKGPTQSFCGVVFTIKRLPHSGYRPPYREERNETDGNAPDCIDNRAIFPWPISFLQAWIKQPLSFNRKEMALELLEESNAKDYLNIPVIARSYSIGKERMKPPRRCVAKE